MTQDVFAANPQEGRKKESSPLLPPTHTPKWHTPTTTNKPQRWSSSHCLLGDHCTHHRSVVVRVSATATVHLTTAEEEMTEEWCFGSLMITLMINLPLWENKRITVLGCPSLLPTVCTEEEEAFKIGRIPHT